MKEKWQYSCSHRETPLDPSRYLGPSLNRGSDVNEPFQGIMVKCQLVAPWDKDSHHKARGMGLP